MLVFSYKVFHPKLSVLIIFSIGQVCFVEYLPQ